MKWVLNKACQNFVRTGQIDTDSLCNYPSILFGLETAILHFEKNRFSFFDTPFSRGEAGHPDQWTDLDGHLREYVETGGREDRSRLPLLKLKIGAIDFEKELEILRFIRRHFSSKEIELRVDANGAFSPKEAMTKLDRLAELDLHSIEQPIRADNGKRWPA